MNVYQNQIIDITDVGLVKINETEQQSVVRYGDILFTLSSETPDAALGKKAVACPTIYLLHGYGGNAKTWIDIKPNLPQIADEKGIIFVCPDGKNSWYWDSPINPSFRYETFISSELVKYIDEHYKTIADRKGRAITGLSMGGHGAMWNAIRHKDTFGAGGSTSGGMDIRPFPKNWDMSKQLGEYESNKEVWDNHTVINQC